MQDRRNEDHPIISYLICATPRSGSTLLCEALRNTGLAGKPDEYFGPMHIKRWDEEWKTKSKAEYLEVDLEFSPDYIDHQRPHGMEINGPEEFK